MLLYIYLGSTAIVWIDQFAHQIYLDKRLKKEGYKFNKNKYFGLADILIGTFYIIALSMPVFNLFFPISHLNKNRSYDEYKNYLLEVGVIDEPELIVKPKVIKIDDTKKVERTNKNNQNYYSPIYREEDNSLDNEKGYTYRKILK